MLRKLGKQKSLKEKNGFRIKYGTINYQQPKSIYVIIETWIQPESERDFESEVKRLSKNIRKVVYENHDKSLYNDYVIVDIDLRSSGMTPNKRSFMSIELTLFPNKLLQFPDDRYTETITNITNIIIDNLQNNNNYTFNTTKK